MPTKKIHAIFTILLVITVCASFLSVRAAHADGETPTEPPAPTQVATEPPTESPTEPPVESTPEPVEATATPLAEILTQVPDSTDVVVLDETGNSVPLAAQEAAEIAAGTDPMWCPEGVSPGGAGCSAGYATISDLINSMSTVSNISFYAQNGVIYFTANPGTGTFNLSPTTLAGNFDALKNYNLTLQGGWNGNTVSPVVSGQTDFSNHPITIGSSGNPWVGNITLNDIVFCGNLVAACSFISQTSLTVYTTTGDITLNNVDVNNQANGNNTAHLETTSGDIAVSDGVFDGNNSNSAGFFAMTGSGSILISNTSFTDNKKPAPPNTFDGATLSAPIVTLTNVTATNNDGNGITINNSNIVTLNNVVASSNGTDITPVGFTNNIGSGVFFNGNVGSNLFINGGTFNNNQRYGVEVGNPADTTIYIQSNPTCTGNDSNAAPISSCYNDTTISDNTAPLITANASGTIGLNGWYTSDVSVSWLVADPESGILSSTGYAAVNLTSDTTSTTLTCSATNNLGLSNSASVTIKIDKTAPVLSLPSDITTSASGSVIVNYSASATDNFDPSVSANCSPASGSTFAVGTTTVSCFATDSAGNTALGDFHITVVDTTVIVTPTPSPNPTPSSAGSSSGSSNAPALIIPVTSGKVIDLGCNSSFWVFGIKLSFMGLCDYQTTLANIGVKDLPGVLPDGYSFVIGLNLSILSNHQPIAELPSGASIQLDFPMLNGSTDQFAVLSWNGSEWVEVPSQSSNDPSFYQVMTTSQTGIFILVKK